MPNSTRPTVLTLVVFLAAAALIGCASDTGMPAPRDLDPDPDPMPDPMTATPTAADLALANSLIDAWADSSGAYCTCGFMDDGFATADECVMAYTEPPPAAYVDCLALAVSGQDAMIGCWASAERGFTTCMGTEMCAGLATCDTQYETAFDACPSLPAVETAIDGCNPGEE